MSLHRYQSGQPQQEPEPGKRVNKYLGPESEWAKQGFNSQAEVTDAFNNELYQTDPEFREAVIIMLSNNDTHAPGAAGSGIQIGNGILERAMSNPDAARKAEDAACWNEYVEKLFGDPRYETSALYRREVRELISKHQDQFDASPLAGRVVDRTGQAMRVEIHGDALTEAQNQLKAEQKAQAKASAHDAAREAARRAYFRAMEMDDPGEEGEHGVSDESIFNDDSDNSPQPVTA